LSQLKTVVSSFSDNSWKRKQNTLQMRSEGEIETYLNQVTDLLLNLSREKEVQLPIQKELNSLKVKDAQLREENAALKAEIKQLRQESRSQ
jgi:hypothetical protein